jgi:predicted ferric reductase
LNRPRALRVYLGMTAAKEPLTRVARPVPVPVTHPARTGRLVLWAVIAVNVLIVEVMWLTDPTPNKNTLTAIGRWLALHAALIMILQLLLVARLPWLDRRIGFDRLTTWHRWTGFTLFWAVLLHPAFILIGYGQADHAPVTKEISNLIGMTPTLLGFLAVGIIVVAAGFSVRMARRRLPYEAWHAVHVLLYVAVAFALIHQAYEGTTFRTNILTTGYWWLLWTAAIVALLAGRFAMPLWRNARHGFRVAAVVPESDNVVSVYVTGRRLDRLPARAGQFMIWRFPGYGKWWQANPFSLSAAPDGRSLRLTAKAVGRTSAGLRRIPVGTRVFAEGPYGAFTGLHRTRPATLLIAGGVGITPVRALLEELTGPITVLYRVQSPKDAVLLAEVQQLARMKGAQVHVLTGRTGVGHPPNVPFDPRNLLALVPDVVQRDVFVCGPPAMTSAVLRSLRTLRVPRAQVHAERFSLAG